MNTGSVSTKRSSSWISTVACPTHNAESLASGRLGSTILCATTALFRRGEIALQGAPRKTTACQSQTQSEHQEAIEAHQNSRIVKAVISSRRASQGDTVRLSPNAPLNVKIPRSADALPPLAAR